MLFFVFWGIFFFLRVKNLGDTMKRFIVTTILTVIIVAILAHFMPKGFDSYLDEFADATVTIYCRQTELESVNMGLGYKVTCDAANFREVAARCGNIDGVCVSFAGSDEDVARICRFFRLQATHTFEQDGLQVVCGKSRKIKGGVLSGRNVVNLQIAYKDGIVHVGSPLILGDY